MLLPQEGRPMSQDMLDIERKIARSRILLSLFALTAVYMDPINPILIRDIGFAGGPLRSDAHALGVLGAHLGYSLAVLASLGLGLVPRGIVALTTWVDVLFGAVIALFTQGASSPFYVFLAFAVIAAGVRGGFRFGMVVTSVSIWLYLSLILVAATARARRGGARGPGGAPGEHHPRVRRAPHLHPRARRSRDGGPVLRF